MSQLTITKKPHVNAWHSPRCLWPYVLHRRIVKIGGGLAPPKLYLLAWKPPCPVGRETLPLLLYGIQLGPWLSNKGRRLCPNWLCPIVCCWLFNPFNQLLLHLNCTYIMPLADSSIYLIVRKSWMVIVFAYRGNSPLRSCWLCSASNIALFGAHLLRSLNLLSYCETDMFRVCWNS